MREKSDDEGAGVAVTVEGVGGGRGDTATGEALVAAAAGAAAAAAAGALAVAALADFASSHCPGEPRSGEPMSNGGSAERDGAAPDSGGCGAALGGAGAVVLCGVRRWGRSKLSRGIVFSLRWMDGWMGVWGDAERRRFSSSDQFPRFSQFRQVVRPVPVRPSVRPSVWLAGWLAGLLAGWLADWLADWLAGCRCRSPCRSPDHVRSVIVALERAGCQTLAFRVLGFMQNEGCRINTARCLEFCTSNIAIY